jgi:hypothetical protein
MELPAAPAWSAWRVRLQAQALARVLGQAQVGRRELPAW